MMKHTYQTPHSEPFEVQMEESLLQGSVEGMTEVPGSWDEEEVMKFDLSL